MTRALFLAGAALFALLALTACAGNGPRLSHHEYEVEMQAIARDMNSKAAGMQQIANAPSEDAFVELFRQVRDVMQEAADRVGDINPPEEIDEPHGVLADALEETADILDELVESAEDGNVFAAMAALEDAPTDLERDIRAAIAEIRAAGYYIGDSDDWG